MTEDMTTSEILLAILERIPVGESHDYMTVNAHIVKVDDREIDFWIGTKKIPRVVERMAEVAEDNGYKVTFTFGRELQDRPKVITQQGLNKWF